MCLLRLLLLLFVYLCLLNMCVGVLYQLLVLGLPYANGVCVCGVVLLWCVLCCSVQCVCGFCFALFGGDGYYGCGSELDFERGTDLNNATVNCCLNAALCPQLLLCLLSPVPAPYPT